MTQLFISDLHLDASRPEAVDAFEALLRGEARDAERLYILGDLFEAWIGDDHPDSISKRVASALQELHQSGTACYFIRGNRDFLIRSGFATAAGMHILPDCALTEINGERVLLMHGDLLCTDDKQYLRFRKIVHNSLFQRVFLSLPISMRERIAGNARDMSQSDNMIKHESIMDASQATIELMMQRYEVRTLIHGHTHRPAVHKFSMDNNETTRIVLGDWYEQGSILRWDDSGYSLDQLDFNATA
jgi:UDP-2,3-diacylglucosamine hydrolase